MAETFTVRVDGLSALGERMRKLSLAVNQKLAAQAVNAGAQIIKKAAIQKAPEYFEPHTLEGVVVQPGNLKKNIVVKKIKSPLTAEYIVTVRGKKKDGYAARYGRLVEFGTVKMPANSYLRSSFDAQWRAAAEAIAAKLAAGIAKAGG